MTKRCDIHSITNLVATDYQFVLAYSFSQMKDPFDDSWIPVWPESMQECEEFCVSHKDKMANIHPGHLRCDHCGAHFLNGQIWEHKPSGEFITIGHICADNLALIADLTNFDKILAKKKNLLKVRIIGAKKRVEKKKKIREMLKIYPDLGDLLRMDHAIARGMRRNFNYWGELSEKQVKYLRTIRSGVENNTENWISVPNFSGRTTINGTVLSTKLIENGFGEYWKMLVKVDTPNGSWKTWGTVPSNLLNNWVDEEKTKKAVLVGSKIKFDAKIEKCGNDATFSFFNRPTKAEFIEPVIKEVF